MHSASYILTIIFNFDLIDGSYLTEKLSIKLSYQKLPQKQHEFMLKKEKF